MFLSHIFCHLPPSCQVALCCDLTWYKASPGVGVTPLPNTTAAAAALPTVASLQKSQNLNNATVRLSLLVPFPCFRLLAEQNAGSTGTALLCRPLCCFVGSFFRASVQLGILFSFRAAGDMLARLSSLVGAQKSPQRHCFVELQSSTFCTTCFDHMRRYLSLFDGSLP